MTVKQLYINFKTNKLSQKDFLREVRMAVPQWINNLMSLKDTIQVLKNKGVITEEYSIDPRTSFTSVPEYIKKVKELGWITLDDAFAELPEDMEQAEKAQILHQLSKMGLLYHGDSGSPENDKPGDEDRVSTTDVDSILSNVSGTNSITKAAINPSSLNEAKKGIEFANIDVVSPYEYRRGLKIEIEAGHKPEAAKKIVLRNLAKDAIHYTNFIAGIKKSRKKRTDQPTEVKGNSFIDVKNGTVAVGGPAAKESAKNAKKETFDLVKGVQHLSNKSKRAKGIKGVFELPGNPKKVKLKEMLGIDDDSETNTHPENIRDNRDFIVNFFKQAKQTGGITGKEAEGFFDNIELPHDLQIQFLYKLSEMGLLLDEPENPDTEVPTADLSRNDVDKRLHSPRSTLMSQPMHTNESRNKRS